MVAGGHRRAIAIFYNMIIIWRVYTTQSARRTGHITDWFRFVCDELIINHDVTARPADDDVVDPHYSSLLLLSLRITGIILYYYFHRFRELDGSVVSVVVFMVWYYIKSHTTYSHQPAAAAIPMRQILFIANRYATTTLFRPFGVRTRYNKYYYYYVRLQLLSRRWSTCLPCSRGYHEPSNRIPV